MSILWVIKFQSRPSLLMPGKEIRQGAGGGERLTLPSLPLGLHTLPGPAPAPGVPGVPGSLGPRLEQVEQGRDSAGGRSPPRHLSAPARTHPCAPSPHQAPTDGRMDGRTDGAMSRRSEAPTLCPIPVAHWGPRAVPAVTPLSPCCHVLQQGAAGTRCSRGDWGPGCHRVAVSPGSGAWGCSARGQTGPAPRGRSLHRC